MIPFKELTAQDQITLVSKFSSQENPSQYRLSIIPAGVKHSNRTNLAVHGQLVEKTYKDFDRSWCWNNGMDLSYFIKSLFKSKSTGYSPIHGAWAKEYNFLSSLRSSMTLSFFFMTTLSPLSL